MSLSIVTINANVLQAPQPITLQEMGAFISQGGTNLAAGTYALLQTSASLTPLLSSPLTLNGLTWSGGTAVATTQAVIPGLVSGDTFITTVAGATPSGYNGTYLCTVTGTSTFSFALATNPGAETVPGTYTPPGQGELVAMNTTYWGQGTTQAVYVLELGPNDGSTGPQALQAWITANPTFFYKYLTPRNWDATTGLLALIAAYEAPNAFTYFDVTTTVANYGTYPTVKNLMLLIESPNLPLTEFSLAAEFQTTLNYAPSASNRQTQLCFNFMNGVTQYPTIGNNALLATLKTANVNYMAPAAEGGLTNTMLVWGNVMSGVDFSWWYAADWIQLNADQTAANIVINGSQPGNPNPLYFNQNGIDQLQDGIVSLVASAIAFGLGAGSVTRAALSPTAFQAALNAGTYSGQCVVQAIPFSQYIALNPNDYAVGRYSGITIVFIPQNGFKAIVFNVTITNLISSL